MSLDNYYARDRAIRTVAARNVLNMTEEERTKELTNRIVDELENQDISDEDLLVLLYPRPPKSAS